MPPQARSPGFLPLARAALRVALLACLLAPGCGVETELSRSAAALGPVEGRERQGRHLLGKTVDRLTGPGLWTVAPTAVSGERLAAPAGFLEVIGRGGDDAELAGLVLPGADGSLLRIEGSDAAAATDGRYGAYQLSRQRSSSSPWEPLCKDRGWAIPLEGSWHTAGAHRAGANLSFACADGVAAKCVTWGYLPWLDARSWDLHQACTQMARADYCADGRSRTMDGTEVAIFDYEASTDKSEPPASDWVLPAPTLPLARGHMWFEAAWRIPLNGGPRTPLCLSKLRWQSLPPAPCGGALPDPRVEDVGALAAYCEDLLPGDLARLRSDGAVLFNWSSYNDIGLYRWRNGPRSFTTTRGFDGGARGGDTVPPAAGFTDGEYLGAIATQPGDGRLELRSYRHPITRAVVTTTRTPPASYSDDLGAEGYVFDAPVGPTSLPLRLYRELASSRFVTTTARLPRWRYRQVAVLGHVFGP